MNSHQFRDAAIAAIITMSLTGCATLITGASQTIRVSSEPSEAAVRIYDGAGAVVYDSRTPAAVSLKKGDGFFKAASYRVVIEKEGFKPREVLIKGDMQVGWYIVGNFFLGGLLGWLVVDPASGAMWTLSPEAVTATLSRDAAAAQQPGDIRVVLLEDVPEGMRASLQPIAEQGS